MLDSVLSVLETSAKYGFTDLILAAGLFGGIQRLLRPKTVKRIDGLEVLVCIAGEQSLEIEVRNLTNDTVYIYRPYFRRGHHANIRDFKNPVSLLFLTWVTTDAPEIASSEPRNFSGEHLLRACDENGDPKSPPFAEQRGSIYYRLRLSEKAESAESVLKSGRVGELTLHLVHGREAKTLQVQL
jgi:hypothetical protein